MMEYILDDGKSIFRTVQRLPAAAEDGTISKRDLTKRYADLKSLLVDGGMFDPAVRSHTDVWESDAWDAMYTQIHAINEVKIWRWQPVAAGGGARSVIRNRTPAFFPFLLHKDVPYDLTHLQIYRACDPRPESEQTCLIHSIQTGAADLNIPLDEKAMASVILRYIRGGMGNTSTVHLANIGRALGIRFRLSRQTKNGVKVGKQSDCLKFRIITEYRPNTADAETWPVVPLALHRGHIFYNKALPPCSAHTVISIDCKNNPKLAELQGLRPRPKNKATRLPREEPHDSLWLIQQLEKFGYISPDVVDPRVIIDRLDSSVKLADRSTRKTAQERCEKIAFDNISWPDKASAIPLSVKDPRQSKTSNTKAPGTIAKVPQLCSYDGYSQSKPVGWRIHSSDMRDSFTEKSNPRKPPPSPLETRLKNIDTDHTHYWAGDTEATVNEGAHQLYLWGASPIDSVDSVQDDEFVDIQTNVLDGLSNIARHYTEEIKAFKQTQNNFVKHRKGKAHDEWVRFNARLQSGAIELDTIHLTKVVIYFHNLRYDRAVLEEHLLIYDVLERENTVYELKLKHADYPEILFVFRDSSKHLTNMSVAQMPEKMGLPSRFNKKSTGIYYEFFKQGTRGCSVTAQEYINTRPDKLQSDASALDTVNTMLCEFFADTKQPGQFVPLGLEDSFCPDVLYRWYLKYDVLVLVMAMRSYEEALKNVSQDHLATHARFRPLHYPTISSYSRALLSAAGAFDECVKYSLGLRGYIQRAVRGGRTSCHSDFEGKVVSFPGGIDDLDGVSLYPSAIASLPGFPTGMPQPIPDEHCSVDSIKEEAYTAVVTVRIKAIRKKVNFMQPIIAYRDDSGVMSFIQELPNGEPFVDTLHLIDLEEYIRIHDIDFDILYGVWWHKRPHVLFTSGDGEGHKIQFWDQAEQEEPLNTAWPKLAYKLHEARKAAKAMFKKTGDVRYEIQANMLKLIANSGYGGTVLRISDMETNVRVKDPEPAEINENEDEEDVETKSVTRTETYLFNHHGSIHGFRETKQNVFIQQHQNDHSSSYNIMGVMILAQSRRNLNRVLESYEAVGAYHVYGDTDSVHGPRALTQQIAAHYDAHRDPSYPPLLGKELLQFHVDFNTNDFTIYTTGFLDSAVSVWPKEAKDTDIYSSKLILIRKKVYLHMLSVDYKTTCPITGEIISKRAFGLTCRCKGVTQKGLYRQAYLLGKSYQDGEAKDPYADEDLDYADPTSRGLLSIYKQVLAGYVVPINLLTDRGDVRFYFKQGSVTTSAVPCSRTMQLSEPVRKRARCEETPTVSPKRLCIDSDSMDVEEIYTPPPTTFICIDMDD